MTTDQGLSSHHFLNETHLNGGRNIRNRASRPMTVMSSCGNHEPAIHRPSVTTMTSMPQISSLPNPEISERSFWIRSIASSLIGSGLNILTMVNHAMGSKTMFMMMPRTIQFANVTVMPNACSAKPMAKMLTTLPTGVIQPPI